VELPEVLPPQLCLRVDHTGNHRVRLTWSVQYRTGEEVRRLPLAAEAPDPGRDVAAEERLVRSLPLPADRLWQDGPERRLAPTAVLRGMDTVVLTTEVLPRLADAGVLVEVTGEPADYRHTEAAPVVHVSATDGPDADWFDLGVTVTWTARTSRSRCCSRRWPPASRTWCCPAGRGSTSAVRSSTACAG
jgi:hypothetical protein